MKKYNVLIVDDDPSIRVILDRVCKIMDWTADNATTGEEAIKLINKKKHHIFILDVKMPGPAGIELARIILKQQEAPAILILTGYAEIKEAVEAMKEGVFDYIQKDSVRVEELQKILKHAAMFHENRLWSLQIRKDREKTFKNIDTANKQFQAILELSNDLIFIFNSKTGKITDCNASACKYLNYSHNELTTFQISDICMDFPQSEWNEIIHHGLIDKNLVIEKTLKTKDGSTIIVEISLAFVYLEYEGFITAIARDVSERKSLEHKGQEYYEQQQKILTQTIEMMALAFEKRDIYTAGHQHRVAQLAEKIGKKLSLSKKRIEGLYLGGLIHDIGKISIPTDILNKPGKITNEELELIQTHAQIGYDIVKDIDFPWPIAEMIIQHHERINGSGYPNKLSGDEILLESKILCVSDVVEAMASHRPYRAALGLEKALNEISSNKAILYDKDVVDSCLSVFEDDDFEFESKP